jgi:8-oxo-dGTP diphosphatase
MPASAARTASAARASIDACRHSDRRACEETGLEVEIAALQFLGVVHRLSDTNRIDFFVRAEHFSGEPRIVEPDKCDRLEWHDPRRLPAETVAYVRAALEAGEPPWVLELGWPDGA